MKSLYVYLLSVFILPDDFREVLYAFRSEVASYILEGIREEMENTESHLQSIIHLMGSRGNPVLNS